MERDFEKDMMELDAAIKSNAERDNTFTLSVLQRAKTIILQQQAKLATYEDTGWVPVAERLPEDDTDMIVCKVDSIIDMAFWDGYYWRSMTTDFAIDVCAWMPLPEPFNQQN